MFMPITFCSGEELVKPLLDQMDVECEFLKNHHLIMRLGKNPIWDRNLIDNHVMNLDAFSMDYYSGIRSLA